MRVAPSGKNKINIYLEKCKSMQIRVLSYLYRTLSMSKMMRTIMAKTAPIEVHL